MELPPAIDQPNVYPLSWHAHTKSSRKSGTRRNAMWDPKKLPWDTFNASKYTWGAARGDRLLVDAAFGVRRLGAARLCIRLHQDVRSA